MDIIQKLTEELSVKRWQVEAAVTLIDEGNTIPFISRYRKEATGALNDEQLRKLHERLLYLRNLEAKKEQVLATIEEQGKLTEELKAQILAAETLIVVEDLYRPFRPKRRTRAIIAKEKGLEPLAALIMLQKTEIPLEEAAKAYISEEKEPVKNFVPEMLAEEVRKLNAQLGIPAGLSELGVTEDKIEVMAIDAMKSGNIAVNPRTSTQKDIERLYYKAL